MEIDPVALKNKLLEIKKNGYTSTSEKNLDQLISTMLNNIGSTDPELRDDLIYTIFSYWLIKTDLLNNKLRDMLQICTDNNHLFYKIGENNTDSVFTRSFSVLILPLILYNHRQRNFFSQDEINKIYKSVRKYFLEEQDIRGYVPDKGWAHSVAHTADTIDELALCSEIGYNELKDMLNIIKSKIHSSDVVFVNEEDERLVTAVVTILKRNELSNDEFIRWIKSIIHYPKKGDYPEDSKVRINIKHLLRSLYFRSLLFDEYYNFTNEIMSALDTLQKNH